jgi:hypothetical protein
MASENKIIKLVLKECLKELMADLSPTQVINDLWQRYKITDTERTQILSARSDVEKRGELIDTLMTK